MASRTSTQPLVSICIPHWQVESLAKICLRSIRRHSARYNLEVIVVDNGSADQSLDWLRSLSWVKLIERPEESPANWPLNVFTAWDRGLREARGKYFVTMHTDVFIKRPDWLDPCRREIGRRDDVAGVGAWKLDLESPWYSLQKRVIGRALRTLKGLMGRKSKAANRDGHYPRDYCAMYRRELLLERGLTFRPIHGQGGGYSIAKQIWDAGLVTRMIPVPELVPRLVHVAHGTAAIAADKPLNHQQAQRKVERKVARLFAENWVCQLRDDDSLDEARSAA